MKFNLTLNDLIKLDTPLNQTDQPYLSFYFTQSVFILIFLLIFLYTSFCPYVSGYFFWSFYLLLSVHIYLDPSASFSCILCSSFLSWFFFRSFCLPRSVLLFSFSLIHSELKRIGRYKLIAVDRKIVKTTKTGLNRVCLIGFPFHAASCHI